MVTGASSGIGRATAMELARRGYHVVAAGRSEDRTRRVLDEIVNDGGSAEFVEVDLASLRSCQRAARKYAGSSSSLDVLVANAGVGGVGGLTEDGFEMHFGVNHLGHFALTYYLLPLLQPHARVVVVSSEAHRRVGGIHFDRMREKRGLLERLSAYGESKLANILFARQLSRVEAGLRTYSLHPGMADTNIFPAIAKPFFRGRRPPHEAARTVIYCATSDEVANHSGLYYSRMAIREPSAAAMDDELAEELWTRSERWCGIQWRE